MGGYGDHEFIHLPKTARVKDYSAAVKGSQAIVKIEIEVGDPSALGYLLTDLGDLKRAGARRSKGS